MRTKSTNRIISQIIIYALLLLLAFIMLVPFAWMISASLKLNKDIFVIPYQWISSEPRWKAQKATSQASRRECTTVNSAQPQPSSRRRQAMVAKQGK